MKNKAVLILSCILTLGMMSNIIAQEAYTVTYEYIDSQKDVLEGRLVITDKESVFKILDSREEGWTYNEDGSKKSYVSNGGGLSNFTYSDSEYSFVRITYPKSKGGTRYRYKEDIIHWELTGNTKKIKDYNCQEALLDLHGRSYTVWFTPDISINKGPLKLHGLPGLIVEVNEKNGFCEMKLLDIKRSEDEKFFYDIKNYFSVRSVLEYAEYEKNIKKRRIGAKIKIANYKAETIKNYGGTLEYSFDNGDYFFVRNIIDIPKGTMKELSKIDL